MTSKNNFKANPVQLLVIGDFGRKATFDFCNHFVENERKIIEDSLDGNDFYDEYRRSLVTVYSWLAEIKKEQINKYRKASIPLDEKVLIGFPGGMPMADAIDWFSYLVLKFLDNLDIQTNVIALPCNTLSPALLEVKNKMGNSGYLNRLKLKFNMEFMDDQWLAKLKNRNIEFIPVAEAVIRYLNKEESANILALGTGGISKVYKEAIQKSNAGFNLIEPDKDLQNLVFKTITASIKNSAYEVTEYTDILTKKISQIRSQLNDSLIVLEACTDLNLGIGESTLSIYARYLAEYVYKIE
ncbi:MAG: hypothetical protein C0594_17735 [Marinilabiliales bacterium]|nr:MAG: hypothetical protein C0594_17735 [Marinilabiliales bacterium]